MLLNSNIVLVLILSIIASIYASNKFNISKSEMSDIPTPYSLSYSKVNYDFYRNQSVLGRSIRSPSLSLLDFAVCSLQCVLPTSPLCIPCLYQTYLSTKKKLCEKLSFMETEFGLSTVTSAGSILTTIGSCTPVVNIVVNTGSIAFTAHGIYSLINKIDCVNNIILQSGHKSNEIDPCLNLLRSYRDQIIILKSASIAHDAASYFPYVGCALIPNKLAMQYGNIFSYSHFSKQWINNNCYSFTPSICDCV